MEGTSGQNQFPQYPFFSSQYLVSFTKCGDFHIITGLQVLWGQKPHWPHLPVKPGPGMKPGTSQVSHRHLFKGGRQESIGRCGVREVGYRAPGLLTGAVIWMDTFIWEKGYNERCK